MNTPHLPYPNNTRTFYTNLSKKLITRITYYLFVCPIVCTLFACSSTKKIGYFQDMPDSAVLQLPAMEPQQRVTQIGDRLLITFGSRDAEAAAVFNRYGGIPTAGSETMASSNSELTGFLVDYNGNLDFPLMGRIKAQGLTLSQLKDTITRKAGLYLKDPYVNARYYDFKVTVLGEVKSPGTYSLTQNKATVFHALGASGDLARSAKRYDLQIFRDSSGVRSVTKIDLRSKNLLDNKRGFLLQNNDVIYVQPRKGGLTGENFGVIAGILAITLSLATLIVTITH
jgi:polysaccharide export outer membrane protein